MSWGYIKFILAPSRIMSLFRHFRQYGITNGYWMWKIECNLMIDSVGNWFEETIQNLKHSASKARWHNDEATADSILVFIEEMKKFHAEHHPHLYEES